MNNFFKRELQPNILSYVSKENKYTEIDDEWIDESEFKMILNIERNLEFVEQLEREEAESSNYNLLKDLNHFKF